MAYDGKFSSNANLKSVIFAALAGLIIVLTVLDVMGHHTIRAAFGGVVAALCWRASSRYDAVGILTHDVESDAG